MKLVIKAITFVWRFIFLLIWTAYLEGSRVGESPEPVSHPWRGPSRPWGPFK